MKKINLSTCCALVLVFIQACVDRTESVTVNQNTNSIDTINIGCLGAYDINPLDSKEKINQVYGTDHIKDGHWITFGFAATKSTGDKTNRIKIEEGYYRKNQKVGFWKFYDEDGTLKDSIEFKNNVPVTSQS